MNTLPYPTEIDTSQFYGTEAYHRVSMFNYVLTDGAKHIAEQAGAYWLMDAIGSHLLNHADEEFVVCTLRTNPDRACVLTLDDGNGRVLAEQTVEWTDYPEPERKFYAVRTEVNLRKCWVIMLPSEY